MIQLGNIKDVVINLSAKGALTAADNLDAKIVPFTGYITAVMVQCGVIGTDGTGSPTQDITVDIKKNGTTIVGTTKITFTHTALLVTPSSYGSLVAVAPIAVTRGDVLSLQGVQILNGTSPTQPLNLCVAMKVSRATNGNPANVILGQLGRLS